MLGRMKCAGHGGGLQGRVWGIMPVGNRREKGEQGRESHMAIEEQMEEAWDPGWS